MSDNGAARSGAECDVREYVQEYVSDPIKGSDLCNCFLGERRERVVRCRDCAMFGAEEEMCWRDPDHRGHGTYAMPGGFCAWGERREDR